MFRPCTPHTMVNSYYTFIPLLINLVSCSYDNTIPPTLSIPFYFHPNAGILDKNFLYSACDRPVHGKSKRPGIALSRTAARFFLARSPLQLRRCLIFRALFGRCHIIFPARLIRTHLRYLVSVNFPLSVPECKAHIDREAV